MEEPKYKENKLIGEGGFAKVYQAINNTTGQEVALKKISKNKLHMTGDEDYYLNALEKEIETMKLCECDNTVKFYEYYEEKDYYTIAMELCDTTLYDYLLPKKNFSIEEIYDIFSNLNRAFKIMNKNKIVHRDIKLENILIKYINTEKTKFIPKLSDFGFSKKIEEKSKNTRLGTMNTMAPEVIQTGIYDSKADLWSLGVIIYYCYFKEYPYKGKDIKKIIKSNTLNYKKPKNIFLSDLIDKLLEINPNQRIDWEEYFNHAFFTLSQFIKFDIGFKNDYLQYYKAKYQEDENNIKNVLIKVMKQNNDLDENFYYNDYGYHETFKNDKNILNFIKPIEFEDEERKKIIYFVYEYTEELIPLAEYCKKHNFEEKEIPKINKNFFNIFKKCADLFISLYSFLVNEKGELKLIDFSLNKKFLSNEEIKVYYAPNPEEMVKSKQPSKTSLMNYGITLLKLINNNDDSIFFENGKFTLKTKYPISQEFNSFLSKILCPDINNRPKWKELENDEFIKGLSDNDKEILLNEKQYDILLNTLLLKYRTINEYYNKVRIDKLNFILENEDFILLTMNEIKIMKDILIDDKEFNSKKHEISLINIYEKNNNNFESSVFNLNSRNCLKYNLINNSYCKGKKNQLIEEIDKIYNELKGKIIEIKTITNSDKFSFIYDDINSDFLENFIKELDISKFHEFSLFLIYKNKENINTTKNIDYNKVFLELNFAKYIIEFLLFFKESIKQSDDVYYNKIYKTKEELFKDINNNFNVEDKKFILISLLCEKIRNNLDFLNDKLKLLKESNDIALKNLIQFYPILLKFIDFSKSKLNK